MYGSFAYRHGPIPAQEWLIAGRAALRSALREGRSFAALAGQVEDSQWWSERELREYQQRSVRNLLEFAARHVPHYRGRAADLAQFPLLEKADVRAAGKALLAQRRRGLLFSSGTSGTTGAPLVLQQDLAAINRENAFVWRQLAWAGLRQGERRAWLRGDMIVPAAQRQPPYWRLNRAENMLMLSSYHLSEAAAPGYLDALARFDPAVIQAYPSSIGFLATWMSSTGVQYRGRSLRGIVTSSETLPEIRRLEIERAFGCRVFDWYGQAERVAAIGTCEDGRYHLLSDYSFVEMLPAGDGLFELVGTGFNNLSMPLIRYRSGDLVRPAPANQRCECGRSFPLIEQVIGRADDAIKLADGRSIGRLDHVFKDVEGILEAQIRQDRPDTITLLVVPAATFDDRTRQRLRGNARHRLGDGVNLDIRLVDAVPRARNGKFKGVVCTI